MANAGNIAVAAPLVSIVVPCCGMLEYTKLCVPSLFDTDIVSAKAREAGFALACCRDLFIDHFGTRTCAHGAPQIQEGHRQ